MHKFLKSIFLFCFLMSQVWGTDTEVWFQREVMPTLRNLMPYMGDRSLNYKIIDKKVPNFTSNFHIQYTSEASLQMMWQTATEPFCGGGMNYADAIHQIEEDFENKSFPVYGESDHTFTPRIFSAPSIDIQAGGLRHAGIFSGKNRVNLGSPSLSLNHSLIHSSFVILHTPQRFGENSESLYSEGASMCLVAIQPKIMRTSVSTAEYPVCLLHGNIRHDAADFHMFNVERFAVIMLDPVAQ